MIEAIPENVTTFARCERGESTADARGDEVDLIVDVPVFKAMVPFPQLVALVGPLAEFFPSHVPKNMGWRLKPPPQSQGSTIFKSSGLVAVVIRLVRTFDGDADVGGLFLAQLGQLHAELVEVES